MAQPRGRRTLDLVKIISESEKNRAYSFGIFTLIVLLVLIIGAVQPTMATILRITDELEKKESVNTQLETKITSLTALTQQYASISRDIDSLPLVFPTQGNFSLFMSNIEEISRDHGYALNSINFSKSDDIDLRLGVLENWSSTISVKGKKSNLIELLEAFEAMPMYPVVTTISYSSTVDESGLTTFSINLAIFHLEDNNFFAKQ